MGSPEELDMGFMQIIEFRTSAIDEVRQIEDEWRRATAGKRTVRHKLLARDHADPDRYFAVMFFDSHESFVENSDLPETQAAAEQYRRMADAPPVWHDLDIIQTAASLS
jgi:hypothetical protein